MFTDNEVHWMKSFGTPRTVELSIDIVGHPDFTFSGKLEQPREIIVFTRDITGSLSNLTPLSIYGPTLGYSGISQVTEVA